MKQGVPNFSWHVLYTRPKFEKQISEEIDQLKIENYLPLRTVLRRWSDRIKKIEEPLFSGYVFVKKDAAKRADLLQIPGVVRFVSTGGVPDVISEEEINKIKLVSAEGKDVQKEDFYAAGDHVMVSRGVFTGMKGTWIRSVNQEHRFLIRLPLLKQAISVEIAAADLIRIH
jgi:transcription antitermination factor NusG